MQKKEIIMNKSISLSLICMDLCNMERAVRELEDSGCEMLHIDVIDGYFSPSMPIGLDMIRQLRKKTDMYFDAHIMAKDNMFFMEQLADIGVGRMCFQIETEIHINKKLSWLKSNGIEAGVALAPGTSISLIEYVLEQCDFVLLMMINPGFASDKTEKISDGCRQKLGDLYEMIQRRGLQTTITVDGRISPDVIPLYITLGAQTFVAGTSSLFVKNGCSIRENFETLDGIIKNATRGENIGNDRK